MLVAPLYDRLLGLTLGLTHVAYNNPKITSDCELYLQSWVACALRLCHQSQSLRLDPGGESQQQQQQLVTQAVTDLWENGDRSNLERVFALSLGVFCWCDNDEMLSSWRNVLSADYSAETHTGIELFTIVLRSFLREPPGRTVWLPLKRATTIADLKAFSPKALVELQRSQNAMTSQANDLFLTSTAIACQLPWYGSASKLARRQTQSLESLAIIGVLLGAAFGPIVFQEDVRIFTQTYDAQRIAAEAIAPLWQLWTGIGDHRAITTISLASVLSSV